ncbi:chaplin [Streptomyces roseochromogenus]|uniref:chaplin n=1 Tax=Streptomyces roseochromogenus TaxID=285450 RepID=UPI000ADC5576|nr:chaplin [Streptomyces roseochromogenus]
MRRATRNGVFAVAAATGALAVVLPVSAAFAADGAAADGSAAGSPGLISGNGIQLPVHVPVNVCGNTVNVVGLLNPAVGNACANGDAATAKSRSSRSGGASARGTAQDSPGVLAGNGVQLPVEVPVNVSGNSVNVIGLGNPAEGNRSGNGGLPRTPRRPAPKAPPRHHPAPRPAPQSTASALAHTGTDTTFPAVAAGAALLLTGTALYRRFRSGGTS